MTLRGVTEDYFCPICGPDSSIAVVWMELEVFENGWLGSKPVKLPKYLECKGCGIHFSPASKNTRVKDKVNSSNDHTTKPKGCDSSSG